ncbi:MAG: 2-oxoacid:acceptor oxidoreductase subunit alpha [Desulfobacterota bacterium]|nr:2-oxoacid:acceptor oxidoreductase subunit alpha [Thermodesulfobacteriota bacterium]MDW8001564.1 2-oxoacid:acceptor oxidoreductase subunit alpha [Deltaproteobacteria bacterium]
MNYSIKIGGEAGQGVQTVGETLCQIFAASGLHVFSHQDYESRIRGGHNFYQIRISEDSVMCPKEKVDILLAFDYESVRLHTPELSEIGQILYDSQILKTKISDSRSIDVPFLKIARETGGPDIASNIAAIGAVCGILGVKREILLGVVTNIFAKKGFETVAKNVEAAQAGYDYAIKACIMCPFRLPEPRPRKILISGNEAIALGALVSGLKFYSGYPMTPSTGILNYVAEHSLTFGCIVEQAEDEIAAINMVIGASFAGVRSMTATSGGGFALMVEGLSLAGMTETPLVIVLAQRPGPATGLPTKTEAADLLFALFAGHGEFSRIIFAPGTPLEAFYLTNKAFHLSEKYQVPVIILSDQYLADSQWTFDSLDLESLRYMDMRLRGASFENQKGYKRHLFTDTGVSPLGVPGDARHLVVTDSDEHDEEGHITEDRELRKRMVEKRLFKKLTLIRREIDEPTVYGDVGADIAVLCWGSTYGVVKEAIDRILKDFPISMVHFKEMYPLPYEGHWLEFLKKKRILINVEQNATSQFAKLLRMETGLAVHRNINRFDGRPFGVEDLVERIYAHIE